jgi:ribosomal protein S12 methylthiotransferase
VALRTTCIVGFPGETDDDFQRLLDLLEETHFERVGFFTYSAQAGTRANEMADDVPDAIKFERLERASEHQRLITGERYEGRIGRIAHAIVDRPADRLDAELPWASRGARARLSWQADDIDGITYLDRHDLPPGTIAEVRVDGVVDDYDFRATVRRVLSPAATNAALGGPAAEGGARPRRQLPLAAAGAVPANSAPSSVGSFGR